MACEQKIILRCHSKSVAHESSGINGERPGHLPRDSKEVKASVSCTILKVQSYLCLALFPPHSAKFSGHKFMATKAKESRARKPILFVQTRRHRDAASSAAWKSMNPQTWYAHFRILLRVHHCGERNAKIRDRSPEICFRRSCQSLRSLGRTKEGWFLDNNWPPFLRPGLQGIDTQDFRIQFKSVESAPGILYTSRGKRRK
jgi:hypothetical protein